MRLAGGFVPAPKIISSQHLSANSYFWVETAQGLNHSRKTRQVCKARRRARTVVRGLTLPADLAASLVAALAGNSTPTDNVVRQGMRCCSTRGQRPNAPRLMVARWGFVVCCVAQAPRVSCACARRTVQQTADRCAMKRRAASPPRCVAASSVRPSVRPSVRSSIRPFIRPCLSLPSSLPHSVPRSLPPSVHPSVRPSVAYSLDRLLPPPSLGRTTRLMR